MPKFLNTMSSQLANEIGESKQAVLVGPDDLGPGPFTASYDKGLWFPTPRFCAFVQTGKKFKWTLNRCGDISVIALTLKHSVAAGGGDVWSAGHGTYAESTNTLTLDNDTGDYPTSEESLHKAREAWESIGYQVIFQAREDYAAAPKRLAF